MRSTVDMVDDPDYEEEEPSFSDPEDFVDDIEDEGERKQERSRLSGLVLASYCAPLLRDATKLINAPLCL